MKKFLSLILTAACCATIFCACNKQKEEANEIIPPEQNEISVTEANPFYKKIAESDTRPIAVMIDNDGDYKGPQAGLENAYLIYEVYVEGGNTRMIAFFKDGSEGTDVNETADRIGPVRSARHYFLDFALEHGAIYAHCGWSPKAQSEISSRGVENINGLYDSTAFVRFSQYNNSWHNLYTTYGKLYEGGKDRYGYDMTTDRKGLTYLPEITPLTDGTDAAEVKIPYLVNSVSYTYDSETGLYMRKKGGNDHIMQSDVQLSATNIVILEMQNVDLNDGEGKGRQDLYNTGTGNGTYISGGKAVPITWERPNRDSETKYTYADGTPVSFNPGVTFIQIVPPSMEVLISAPAAE